jgi:polygalacturonase
MLRALVLTFLLAYLPLAHAGSPGCDVRTQGARGDGHTLDTAVIQAAIDRCSQHGGTVYFTPGTYLSAPLELKSHTYLHLDAGATLLGSPSFSDYPVSQAAPWHLVSLLHADHAIDIAITGKGTIDGNGGLWWERQRSDRAQHRKEQLRPMLIDLLHTQRIRIEGVTLQNSPQYNILATLCDHLTVRRVTILNPGRTAPNTDGIDPVSTSHVLIEHSIIDTGDDNIAIKSGLVERGDPNIPSTDITVRDCDLRNGHGLSIGSETAGGVQHVRVEHIRFTGTRQGVRIKSARGRGNDIGDFRFEHLVMSGVETPIQITPYYTGGADTDTAHPITAHTPRFHDFLIRDLEASGAKQAGILFGLPESPASNIRLAHIRIQAQRGLEVRNAQVQMHDVVITAQQGEAVIRGVGAKIDVR